MRRLSTIGANTKVPLPLRYTSWMYLRDIKAIRLLRLDDCFFLFSVGLSLRQGMVESYGGFVVHGRSHAWLNDFR